MDHGQSSTMYICFMNIWVRDSENTLQLDTRVNCLLYLRGTEWLHEVQFVLIHRYRPTPLPVGETQETFYIFTVTWMEKCYFGLIKNNS